VWPATTLAPSFSALEADVAAQLAPVRGIERSQLRADWHRYAVSWSPIISTERRRFRGRLHSPRRPRGPALVSTRGISSVFHPAVPSLARQPGAESHASGTIFSSCARQFEKLGPSQAVSRCLAERERDLIAALAQFARDRELRRPLGEMSFVHCRLTSPLSARVAPHPSALAIRRMTSL
jgi:hypothetical protein